MQPSDPLMADEELALASPRRRRRRLPALLSVAVLAFGAAACGEEESAGPEAGGAGAGGADVVEEEPLQGATGQPQEVALDELLQNPDLYVGQQVAVSGRVTDTDVDGEPARPSAFTIGEGVDADLLVLPTAQAQVPTEQITDSSVVRVEGTVREVTETIAEEGEFLFEQEPATDEFIADLAQRVALVATQVETNIP